MNFINEWYVEFLKHFQVWKSFLSLSAALCSILGGLFLAKQIKNVLIGLICICILWLLAIIIISLVCVLLRRYGNIHSKLAKTMFLIHSLMQDIDNHDENIVSELQKFKDVHANACNEMAMYFSDTKKKKCAVSIKLFKDINQPVAHDLELLSFCRDVQSQVRDTDNYKKRIHKISNNSCFYYVLNQLLENQQDDYYLNNNIPKSEHYVNSSIGAIPGKNGLTGLPYKSELVLPIVPLSRFRRSGENLVGFLCADSSSCHAFNNTVDVMLMKCAADQMYDVIDNWIEKQKGEGQ